LTALRAEIAAAPAEPAASIFFGGGTPNTYGTDQIAALTWSLRKKFPPAGDCTEISIEVNPELVHDGDFERYVDVGIDRVSIGVQSFVRDEIAVLGRKHTMPDVSRAVSLARRAGVRSISIDLIFAIPGQTPSSWQRSLDMAIDLGVDHISAYGLTVEEGTPFAQWRDREPSAFAGDDIEAELFDLAMSSLENAGYEQYEISNFAKPGHRCVHNENYWKNGEYAGFGVGAASYRGGVRSVHTRKLDEYLAAATRGEPIPHEAERLEGVRAVGEAVMLALRTAQGVVLTEFKERYGVDVAAYYASVVARYERDGLLSHTGDALVLTRRGRFVANDVCGAFVTFK
jgi:oxygen-independent coproporphyrinogen III oxidase